MSTLFCITGYKTGGKSKFFSETARPSLLLIVIRFVLPKELNVFGLLHLLHILLLAVNQLRLIFRRDSICLPKKYAMKKFAIFLSLANPEIAFRIYLLWLLERYSLCILTMTSEICSFIVQKKEEKKDSVLGKDIFYED